MGNATGSSLRDQRQQYNTSPIFLVEDECNNSSSCRRKCLGHFEDRPDRLERKNSIQQIGNFMAVDSEDVDQESISFLFDFAAKHLPKMEDSTYARKNFKRYVLPLLKVCTMPPKSVIFRSGEKGTCTYLVAEGQLEVQDTEGNITSTLTRGAMFGETSMLYDCPRSDTVICTTTTTLWRLNRSAYYALQKVINSPALSVNAKRLFEVIPEVVVLPLENKEKLMLRIASSTFTEGMNLYEETKCSTRVMVIEDGYVNIYFSPLLLCRSPEELLRELGISVDLTQCRKHAAENRVVTWEDILNHPLSETQLQEKDGQELGTVSSSTLVHGFVAASPASVSFAFPKDDYDSTDGSEGHTDGSRESSSHIHTPPKVLHDASQSAVTSDVKVSRLPIPSHTTNRRGSTHLPVPSPLGGSTPDTTPTPSTHGLVGSSKQNNPLKPSPIQQSSPASVSSTPRKLVQHISPVSLSASPRNPLIANVTTIVTPRTRTGRLFERNTRSLSPAKLPPLEGTFTPDPNPNPNLTLSPILSLSLTLTLTLTVISTTCVEKATESRLSTSCI